MAINEKLMQSLSDNLTKSIIDYHLAIIGSPPLSPDKFREWQSKYPEGLKHLPTPELLEDYAPPTTPRD